MQQTWIELHVQVYMYVSLQAGRKEGSATSLMIVTVVSVRGGGGG